ncbi:MAG: L-seryl-tRNA(Sec) selenium transferase, partial [Cumulibacter sp.]
MTEPIDPRARVPRTDALLSTAVATAAIESYGRRFVKRVVHDVQDAVREGDVEPAQAIADLEVRLARGLVGVRRVLNGTGVLVHTNLGRSPLSAAALGAISVAAGTCDLELDLATGRRGTRGASLNDALL